MPFYCDNDSESKNDDDDGLVKSLQDNYSCDDIIINGDMQVRMCDLLCSRMSTNFDHTQCLNMIPPSRFVVVFTERYIGLESYQWWVSGRNCVGRE